MQGRCRRAKTNWILDFRKDREVAGTDSAAREETDVQSVGVCGVKKKVERENSCQVVEVLAENFGPTPQ